MPATYGKILTLLLVLGYVPHAINAQLVATQDQFSYYQFQSSPCLQEDQRIAIKAQLQAQLEQLNKEGRIRKVLTRDAMLLQWPLKAASGFEGYNYHTITNFVDLNPDFPNKVQDYNCGTRSFDTSFGYNHAGTDFALWPRPWLLMENNSVEVIAAQGGIIVGKEDGHFDKSCTLANPEPWNAVYIRHVDGTIAWYGHLKAHSLTPKPVGAEVQQGEYLGIVGSSGISTAPHLHFELHDSSGTIIDPFAGNCSDEESSRWNEQREYYDSGINLLKVSRSLPQEEYCSEPEVEKDTSSFCASEELFFITYLRDLRSNQSLSHTILMPDNNIFQQWERQLPSSQNDYFAASMMYQSFALPKDPQPGQWRYNVSYLGKNYTQTFNICSREMEHLKQAVQLQNLFPNPARHQLKLLLKINEEEHLHIEVKDLLGRKHLSQRKYYLIGQHEYQLPVRQLESGVYVLTIEGMKSRTKPIVRRFVVL